jgi:hypothetical protein
MADTKISNLTAATTPLAGTEVLPIVQSGTTKKVAVSDLTAGRAVEVLRLYSGIAYNAGRRINTQSNAGETAAFIGGPNGYALIDNVGSGYSYLSQSVSLTVQDMSGNPIAIFDAATKNVSFYGNLTQFTAAKGINFTANTPAAGMTSQLLNWYEAGTWAPTSTTLTFVGSPTYTGYYVRTGRLVYVTLRIQATSITSASSYINVGFPFVSANIVTTCPVTNGSNNASLGNGIFALSGGNTIIYLPSFSALTDVLFTGYYFV